MSGEHSMCGECWNIRFPDEVPVEFECGLDENSPLCCLCGEPTTSGISFMESPAVLTCKHQ